MGQLSVNTFNKGMNQDVGKTVPQEGSYLNGRNLRIIANEDSQESGVVVNVKGNAFSVDFNVEQSALSPCQDAWVQLGQKYFLEGMLVSAGDFIAYQNVIYYNPSLEGAITESDIEGKCILCGRPTDNANPLYYIEGYGDPSITSFEVPSASELEGLNGEMPVDVIGWTSIRDNVYIFATSNNSFNPGGVLLDEPINPASYGYIYKLTFDLSSNAASSELIYFDSELNFTSRHPIEAVGRYETNSIERLYWTDNFNPPRTINLKDPNILDLTPDDLNLNPSISFSKPKITSVTNGGALPSGMYQYAYRLRNTVGAETRFSPLSGLAHIVQASEGENYWEYSEDPENITEYVGNEPGELCSKAVNIQIDNIDTDYDFIEIAVVYRTTREGISNCYVFSSRKVVSDSMNVIHSSDQNIVALIPLAELTSFSLKINKAKTIETKDNRLFLGNIVSPVDDIEFNARAYRYKRDDEHGHDASIPNSVETYVDDSFDLNADYVTDTEAYEDQDFEYSLQENLDSLNPYNSEIISVVDSSKTYKYQKDGRTIGGEGPFIKYEFIKKELDGDQFVSGTPPQLPPFVEVKPTSTDCSTGETFLDYKNPVVNANYKGYQRDEIYRFGIVFFDTQGNPGGVNWIGDIRFPTHYDIDYKKGADLYNFTLSQTRNTDNLTHAGTVEEYSSTGSQSGITLNINEDNQTNWDNEFSAFGGEGNLVSELGTTQGNMLPNKHSMYALGIKFEVNIPQDIQKRISGWSIVRVERKKQDKTVLGMGMGNYLYRFGKSGNELNSYRAAFNAHSATWPSGGGWNIANKGEIRNNLLSLDSPDFLLSGEYPTASDCDYIEVCGELGTGGSSNSYENDFIQDDDDHFYRKFYSHACNTRNINNKESKVVRGINYRFFSPEQSAKLTQGGSLSSSYVGGDGEQYFKKGIHNFAIRVNDNGQSIDYYSTGAETLYIQFPGYHIGGNQNASYYTESIPDGQNVQVSYPHSDVVLVSTFGEANGNQMYFHQSGTSPFSGASGLDASLSANDDDGGHSNIWDLFKVQEKPLLAWRRERPNQYGGKEKFARDRNVYISASNFVPVTEVARDINSTETEIDVWGGDTYVHFYDMVKMKKWEAVDGRKNKSIKKFNFNYAFPVETTYNLSLREGFHFANKSNFDGKATDELRWDDTSIREFYSAENDLLEYYPKNSEIINTGEYDNRVVYSDEKANGSLKDSWTSFKYNNYKDIDGKYGPINKLILFQDNLFSFQDRGIAMFSINPVAVTTTKDQNSLVLGTGKVVQDYKYLSNDIGSKHQWAIISASKGLYWVDILTNSIYKIAPQSGVMEISRVKGLKNYFESKLENSLFPYTEYLNNIGDNPFYRDGITVGHDAKNNEILFSFLFRNLTGRPPYNITYNNEISETICYSETTQSFTSFYDFSTPMFINTQDKLMSVHPSQLNKLFLHNSGEYGNWYGQSNNTTLEFIVNKYPSETKVFDNLEWHTEILDGTTNIANLTWSSIRMYTDYQESGQTLTPGENIKRRERTWKTAVPREKGSMERFKDKYVTTKLTYINERAYKIRAHYVKTKFRVSKR